MEIIPKMFLIKPVTLDELVKWNENKNENPRTLKKINTKTLNYLQKQYDINFNILEKFNILDSIDDRDPVSFEPFWIIKDNIKHIVYNDISKLILYKDSKNFIRCFEKQSLENLKAHKINTHPITNEIIPDYVFNSVGITDLKKENENKTIEEYCFEVF